MADNSGGSSDDQVDFNILWNTIHHDLPPLIEKLKAALGRA